MKTHTPEPWRVGHVNEANGPALLANYYKGQELRIQWIGTILGEKTRDANAARIVACVNACAGMEDPAAEIAALRQRIAELEAQQNKPQPNWDEAPEWAMWWAVDASEFAWWYEKEPPASDYQWLLVRGGVLANAGSVALNGYDWRETLTKRPE